MEPTRFAAIFMAIFPAVFAAILCSMIAAFQLSEKQSGAARDRRMAEHRMNARLLRLNI